ncbi:MAG: hypothetical protein P9L92_18760 [Candidatus Electryonea clarkiae]|nr:hypothetical protein [Candidatus Electryonea clarkiae]MDP8287841.1 hypothetical protein [Candidatus Electryonea clarkiae]
MSIDLTRAKSLKTTIIDHSRSANLALYHEAQEEGLTLSDKLEQLDPSPRNAEGKCVTELDAFERQLAVHDITTTGRNAITVEQFFVGGAMILLPEYILREIRMGYRMVQDPTELIAVTVPATGPTVRPIYIETEKAKKSVAKRASGGAAFPKVQLLYRDKEAAIIDRGRQFDFSYRIVKNQNLAEFRVFLWWIGAQLAYDEIDAIYDIVKNGDGASPAASDVFSGTPGIFAYADMVHLASSFDVPARMSHILANASDIEVVLNMSQFQDALTFPASTLFQRSGEYGTFLPVNAKLVKVPSATATEVMAIDNRFAVRESVSQPLMIEADKVIERKLETAVISKEAVYTVMVDDARKLSNY